MNFKFIEENFIWDERYVPELILSYKATPIEKKDYSDSENVAEGVRKFMEKGTFDLHENAGFFLTNKDNYPIAVYRLAKGAQTACTYDERLIIGLALINLAHGIVMFHTHPDDDFRPSDEDIENTVYFNSKVRVMELIHLDDLIVTENKHFSFRSADLIA